MWFGTHQPPNFFMTPAPLFTAMQRLQVASQSTVDYVGYVLILMILLYLFKQLFLYPSIYPHDYIHIILYCFTNDLLNPNLFITHVLALLME